MKMNQESKILMILK